MKFLVDNAISPVIAEKLREGGYSAAHVREFGMGASADLEIFNKAKAEGFTIISADIDFTALVAFNPEARPSLILFRRGLEYRPLKQVELLLQNLPQLEAHIDQGCIATFEESRIRIRALPMQP
jgi:predicted nuclease of predicted toxin-antitoxin system